MRIPLLFLLIFGLSVVGGGEEVVQNEIEYLLSYIEHSGARFLRNGKEYTAPEAANHMRTKLRRGGGRIKTADDFVKGIATKSYLTGGTYLVKLPDDKCVPTGEWLTEALARHRQKK